MTRILVLAALLVFMTGCPQESCYRFCRSVARSCFFAAKGNAGAAARCSESHRKCSDGCGGK